MITHQFLEVPSSLLQTDVKLHNVRVHQGAGCNSFVGAEQLPQPAQENWAPRVVYGILSLVAPIVMLPEQSVRL